jgi:DNA-binding GntR family transcriptional regulator
MKPGERLNESALSLRLDVSRAPIREALKMLEAEGLVETRPRRGTFVTDISVKEIEDAYVVISLISVAAAKLAAANMTEQRRKELRSIIRGIMAIENSSDIEKVKNHSKRLQDFVIRASQNKLLLRIHQVLDLQHDRFKASGIGYGEGDVADMVREYLNISEALLEGSVAKAEYFTAQHLEKSRLRVLKALKKTVPPMVGEPTEQRVGKNES